MMSLGQAVKWASTTSTWQPCLQPDGVGPQGATFTASPGVCARLQYLHQAFKSCSNPCAAFTRLGTHALAHTHTLPFSAHAGRWQEVRLVPAFFAVYILITNILLINLLIGKRERAPG